MLISYFDWYDERDDQTGDFIEDAVRRGPQRDEGETKIRKDARISRPAGAFQLRESRSRGC